MPEFSFIDYVDEYNNNIGFLVNVLKYRNFGKYNKIDGILVNILKIPEY